ncbi:MAG: hypothetical protein CL910_00010 [Deltaproteobacteria bacterium]|nr:hypothetical protein [Deltaproteobacteria bacterium]
MPNDLPQPGPRPAVLTALRQVLRPLVRFLLDQGFTFPMLSRLLKEVYVEVADRELPLEGRAQTTTRLSLLTGVHRKDVKRLKEQPVAVDPSQAHAPLGALIAVRWTSEEAYLDEQGRPRSLLRRAPPGEPSFEALVAEVSTDIRARAVLDEWLRLGVARLDDQGRVHLQVDAFVPESGFDEKTWFFGRNTRDHLLAATHNLRGDTPSMPDRAVYYSGLSEASTEELAELAEKVGMEALQTLNRRARTLKQRDRRRGGGGRRMTLGFYFFRGSEEDDDSQEPADG